MSRSLLRVVTVVAVAVCTIVAGGVSSAALAAYQPSAGRSWVPNGTVYAMAQVGDTVYLGGDFTTLRNPATGENVDRFHLAALDATTGAPTTWNPGANNSVRALAVGAEGTVFAGGSFTSAAGVAASRLAAITPTGAAVTGWSAAANNTVRDITADSSGLYVAGGFGTINGITRARLARLSPTTGAVDTTFDAQVAGGSVYSIVKTGDSLLLGGAFTSIGSTARMFSGSVSITSGAVTSWAPASQCGTCWILDLATDGTNVYEAIGGPGGRAVAFALDSGSRAWSRSGDGDVQAIAVHNGVVYAGGHFTTFGGFTRRQLVPLSASSGAPQSYTIRFTGNDHPGVWAITASSTTLRIGGGFLLANNPAARYATFSTI